MILTAYALLVALPVALGWWLIGPARPWLDEASSAIAMMAMAALLLELGYREDYWRPWGGHAHYVTPEWHC